MVSLCNIVVFSLLFAYSINEAIGLKCYHCSTLHNDTDCKKDPKKYAVMDCNTHSLSKYKHEKGYKELLNNPNEMEDPKDEEWNCAISINRDSKGETFTRTCSGAKSVCKDKKEHSNSGGLEIILECCNTDYCNSSFKTNAGLFTLSACLVFIVLFWK